ncbi:hypothetical protein B0A50_01612 [Salinomyces thailandicus]|uniref:Uncharacterized protein n=1 Tax=Salinomyces thailandicus TaxID=706561 RepID=A0A4U0UBA7_9PEZI|nr:hypothetical protein B0A50_01612 [Salinomyces thailandica]
MDATTMRLPFTPPTDLKLDRSNGLTTIPITDLKQLIGNVHTEACATKTQVPRPKPRKRAPKTPALAMGNKPSSVNGSPEPDDASLNSVVRRRPMRVLRKSSTNLFKRIDSKSPLPRPLTATSIVVTDRKPPEHDESPIDPFMEPAHKAREPIILHSDSTITVDIHSGSSRQSSATTTVVSSGKENRISFQATIEDASEHEEDEPPVPAPRASALSPTIPAPSPLPEDSPHKYGLKDRMETPEPDAFEPPPEPTELNKARRRSSGLEIFNEAKSLQSAQSFLNGLSTSRRRAESTNRTDTTCTTTTTSTSRPASRPTSRPSSSMHLNANPNGNGNTDHGNNPRTRGHNFKPTGFAYSRALTLPQLSCFRSHARLLRSRNKAAPVECAVCHMDDEHEHWTCSWCALRMCRYCRRAFVEGGVKALRGRVREAEMGAGSESEGGRGRGRSRGVV